LNIQGFKIIAQTFVLQILKSQLGLYKKTNDQILRVYFFCGGWCPTLTLLLLLFFPPPSPPHVHLLSFSLLAIYSIYLKDKKFQANKKSVM